MSSKTNRVNLINVPILSSLSESRFSNNSIRISLFNACSISTSVKQSEINNFILDHQIDVFFIVETWLKGVGDEAKIADLTPSGYATRSFPQAHRGGLAIIARSHILQNIAFKSSFSFEHNSFELFQAHYHWKKGLSTFSVFTDLHLIAEINLLIPCLLNNCLDFWNTAIPLQVVCWSWAISIFILINWSTFVWSSWPIQNLN